MEKTDFCTVVRKIRRMCNTVPCESCMFFDEDAEYRCQIGPMLLGATEGGQYVDERKIMYDVMKWAEENPAEWDDDSE